MYYNNRQQFRLDQVPGLLILHHYFIRKAAMKLMFVEYNCFLRLFLSDHDTVPPHNTAATSHHNLAAPLPLHNTTATSHNLHLKPLLPPHNTTTT